MTTHERCMKCIYHAPDSEMYGCDYLSLTGHSRTSQVENVEDLDPERCPLFKRGDKMPNNFWKENSPF